MSLQNTRSHQQQRFKEIQSGDQRETTLPHRLRDAVPRLQCYCSGGRGETTSQVQTIDDPPHQVGRGHSQG